MTHHTKGEWKVTDGKGKFLSEKSKWTADHPGDTTSFPVMCGSRTICMMVNRDFKDDESETTENGFLIAEAGTVATECGLTPRQLLDQRNELLEALKKAHSYLLDCGDIGNSI